MSDPRYPNLRGTAPRNGNKNKRVSTHVMVSDHIFASSSIGRIVEHGMGRVSTSYYHERKLPLLSIEDHPKWNVCIVCSNKDAAHTVIGISGSSDVVKGWIGDDAACTFALVDGPGCDRFSVLCCLMTLGVGWIVEHDAETFSADEVTSRRELAKEHGYVSLQYIGAQPESAVYVKVRPDYMGDGYVDL